MNSTFEAHVHFLSLHWDLVWFRPKSLGKKDCQGLQKSRRKAMGAAQGRSYLSDRFDIFPDHTRGEGHTTLRNGPVEEVLGQRRQHLTGRSRACIHRSGQ